MATSAQYATAPTLEVAQVSTANTNRDGTGTTVRVAQGPSVAAASGVGKRIVGVYIQAVSTTTTGMIRFFISTDGGTTKRLIDEVVVNAITPAAGTPAFSATAAALVGLVLTGQVSSLNCEIYASTEKAETFNIVVAGATY